MLHRLPCPAHGVRREQVPFAWASSGFTRDFEDLVGWLPTTMDKTAGCRLLRVDWDIVGRIVTGIMDDGLDPERLDSLFEIGVDEVSWRRRYHYLTLVSDHRRGRLVWGAEGADTATLDRFLAELGPSRAARIGAVSSDISAGYATSLAAGHAPRAVICYDPLRGIPRKGSYVRPRIMAAPDERGRVRAGHRGCQERRVSIIRWS